MADGSQIGLILFLRKLPDTELIALSVSHSDSTDCTARERIAVDGARLAPIRADRR